MSPQQGLQITSVAPIADDEWVNVHGVGEYQRVLAGMVPCTVQVELFPWDREERVTARVNGQRVGELSDGFAGKVHAVLHARRVTGLAPIIVEGEVRRDGSVGGFGSHLCGSVEPAPQLPFAVFVS